VLKIVPIIMSGGAGSRLWPLSTESRPKQFHALAGQKSMFANTLNRVAPGEDIAFAPPFIVCGDSHEAMAREVCLEEQVHDVRFVLEPIARNTAPALAAVAYAQSLIDPNALMLVLPADHIITKPEVLRQACTDAAGAAEQGKIVTFGIVPDKPETGYGYIKSGAALDAHVQTVAAFREKPSLDVAQSYLRSGEYSWNAGIFYFQCGAFLNELALHAPEVLAAAREAVEAGRDSQHDVRLDREAFVKAPAISIDYAVMEQTSNAAVIPVDMGWNDVGSFETLWHVSDKDDSANAAVGPVFLDQSSGCLVRSNTVPVAVMGMSDVMVIVTEHGVLVAPRERAQDVRLAAAAFKDGPRSGK
jgi:mannose-1-phosphate guanylyltransferase / mannose-6-phosphate isomerase